MRRMIDEQDDADYRHWDSRGREQPRYGQRFRISADSAEPNQRYQVADQGSARIARDIRGRRDAVNVSQLQRFSNG